MKLFGYSISLNILILIGILYLIMVVNALSSSCNREGLTPKSAQQTITSTVNRANAESNAGTLTKAKRDGYVLTIKNNIPALGSSTTARNAAESNANTVNSLPIKN